MSRRWSLWFAGLLLMALLALVPLRIALVGLVEQGFTARQVAGTVWYGRIGELSLRARRLGTFEVRLDPGPLLVGAVQLGFHRMDDPNGSLDGTLVAGAARGIGSTSGRLAIAGLAGQIPVDTLQLDDVTILFRGGQCVEASGRVTMLVAASLPGLSGAQFQGAPACDGERVRFVLAGPAGAEVEFFVRANGELRAWLRLPPTDPAAAAALSAAGFRDSAQGWMLSAQGRL